MFEVCKHGSAWEVPVAQLASWNPSKKPGKVDCELMVSALERWGVETRGSLGFTAAFRDSPTKFSFSEGHSQNNLTLTSALHVHLSTDVHACTHTCLYTHMQTDVRGLGV